MFLIASTTFWPSRRTPRAINSEMGRGLAIEPDFDHGAVEDQAEDVVAGEITLLPGLPGGAGPLPDRLTTSLPTWPSNNLANTRRARRVFMPAR
jgi:hypothetical protein